MIAGCSPAPAPPSSAQAPVAPVLAKPTAEAVPKTVEPKSEDVMPSDSPIEPVIAEEEPASAEPADSDTPFQLEDGFTPLTLDDFQSFGAEPDTWTATEDGFRSTGKPKGYVYSQADHQNFTWRLEYRFDRPKSLKDDAKFKGNTGFLVYINGEHKLWPVCLEVQGKHVQMAAIKENGGAAPVTVQDDDAARQAARKPVGQWNRLEIVSKEGTLTVKLNDVVISRSEANFLSAGKIGIQAEDHPFAVRRMRIRDE
jgi:hypothetical protein